MRVVSAMAAVEAVAKVTDAQPAGVVFAPLASPDGRLNRLFPAIVDAQSKTPALGHWPCGWKGGIPMPEASPC